MYVATTVEHRLSCYYARTFFRPVLGYAFVQVCTVMYNNGNVCLFKALYKSNKVQSDFTITCFS